MSPNGRRAWRKWMRRVEHDPNLRPQGKSISLLAREGKRHLGSIPPTPAKPFTARSIVGMSQSSRKRKARAVAFVVINSVTFFEHAVPLASALHERLYRERGFPRHSEEMRLVRDVRAKYRIGECLRPCPGCCACGVTSEEYPIPWCDGSGVLPTRTRK